MTDNETEICRLNDLLDAANDRIEELEGLLERGKLDGANEGETLDETLDDRNAVVALAAGEFMDRFDAYRRRQSPFVADSQVRAGTTNDATNGL